MPTTTTPIPAELPSNYNQLKALANEHGIDAPVGTSRADLVAKLEAKRDEHASEQGSGEQQPPRSARRRYADWPQKGDDRAQPWDLDAVGVDKQDRDLEPGAPDTVSPIVVRHSAPILASGAAHPIVADLGRRLAALGYPNSVSEGTNPFNVVDDTVLSAVERFREDYGVEEDPTPFGGRSAAAKMQAANIIGPYTWEAVLRVSDRDAEE